MADIRAQCPTCGKEVVVSEFARSVVCRACNSNVTLGGASAEKSKTSPDLKFRSIERASAQTTEAKSGPNLKETAENIRQRTERGDTGSRDWRNHPAASWGVFVVLGGLMGWLRFGNSLPPDYLEMMKSYGPYVALVLHVLITVRAFEDSILHGALCLLLPPYAYYYLFVTSDYFMLRAVVSGFLAGIGLDTFVIVKAQSIAIYQSVTAWIASGG